MSGYNHLIDEALEQLRLGHDGTVTDLLEIIRPKTEEVEVVSIFGRKTRKPYVELRLGDKGVTQWSPEEARGHARQVLEAAEASEQDAFFIEFITVRVGATDQAAAGMLQDFRAFRAAQREKE